MASAEGSKTEAKNDEAGSYFNYRVEKKYAAF